MSPELPSAQHRDSIRRDNLYRPSLQLDTLHRDALHRDALQREGLHRYSVVRYRGFVLIPQPDLTWLVRPERSPLRMLPFRAPASSLEDVKALVDWRLSQRSKGTQTGSAEVRPQTGSDQAA